MNIDSFGVSYVVDKATKVVLTHSRFNLVSKCVTQVMLDTAVYQYSDAMFKKFQEAADKKQRNVVLVGLNQFVAENTLDVSAKKVRARLIRKAAYLMFEQSFIIGQSYDGLSALSLDDLPGYFRNKSRYVETFARSTTTSLSAAEKHLDFLAASLSDIDLRRKDIVWHLTPKLADIVDETSYVQWAEYAVDYTTKVGNV